MPIANALRPQLAWTHYRALLKISGETARKWYVEEALKGNGQTGSSKDKSKPQEQEDENKNHFIAAPCPSGISVNGGMPLITRTEF